MNSKKTNHGQVKSFKKHDANLRKNSTLYFQVGLIVVLIFSYFIVESHIKKVEVVPDTLTIADNGPINYNRKFEIEKKKVEEVVKKKKPKESDVFEIVDNDTKDVVPDNFIDQPVTSDGDDKFDPNAVEVVDNTPVIDTVILDVLEDKPIFPGCEDASDKAKCMQEKIDKVINRKFDRDIGADYGLEGKQVIYVSFLIGADGVIKDIKPMVKGKKVANMDPKAKAALEKEAKRVIASMPKFTPGKQRGKAVNVPYVVPIKFVVTD